MVIYNTTRAGKEFFEVRGHTENFCTNPKGEGKNFLYDRGLQETVRPEGGIYFTICRARGMSLDPKLRHSRHRSLFCNSFLVRMT